LQYALKGIRLHQGYSTTNVFIWPGISGLPFFSDRFDDLKRSLYSLYFINNIPAWY